MLEKQIEAYLVRRIKDAGGVSYKFTSPANRGVADRIVILPGGQVWFIELKTETGRLSPLQDVFRQEINKVGGNYTCLYGKSDVERWLEAVL